MIDIHSHIIFGVDDGPSTIEQSIRMIHEAKKAGISIIIATPHFHESLFDLNRLFDNYQEVLYRTSSCNVEILLGYEVFINPFMAGANKDKRLLTLADTRCMLFEFPFNSLPVYGYDAIFKLQLEKIVPIIAHPERNRNFVKNIDKFLGYVQSGCMVQLDAASIVGVYGRKVRDFAKKLIKLGMVNFIASDAHYPEDYTIRFVKAYREVSKWTGEENAHRLFHGNACEMLKERNKYTCNVI